MKHDDRILATLIIKNINENIEQLIIYILDLLKSFMINVNYYNIDTVYKNKDKLIKIKEFLFNIKSFLEWFNDETKR